VSPVTRQGQVTVSPPSRDKCRKHDISPFTTQVQTRRHFTVYNRTISRLQ